MAKTCQAQSRRGVIIAVTGAVAAGISLLLYLDGPERLRTTAPEEATNMQQPSSAFHLAGREYSERLRNLYLSVEMAYGRPLRVEEISGSVDNNIEVRPREIVLRLKPGSSEDNVAHELMHAILEKEGFPKIFSLRVFPLSTNLANLIRADLDHLVVNNRLLDIGYDAQQGFLRTVAPVTSFLQMPVPSDPRQKAVYEIGALHELVKYAHYVGGVNPILR